MSGSPASHLLQHGLQGFADRCRSHTLGAKVAHFRKLKQIKEGKSIGNWDETRFLPASQLVGRDVQDPKDVRSTELVHLGSARNCRTACHDYERKQILTQVETAQSGGKQGFASLYGFGNPQLQSDKADVAQLVEQSIRNRQVIGSSPIVGSSNFFCFHQRPSVNGGRRF